MTRKGGAAGAAAPRALATASLARTTAPLALALAALAAACAERRPPPGGPVDDVAPMVVAVEPADGARGVAPGTPIRITFSEEMNRKSVERALRLAPNAERAERAWEGNALVVTAPPDAPAGPHGERVVSLLRIAEDKRGNRLVEPLEVAFTSGDSLPDGEIEGRLGGAADPRARVLLFRAPSPTPDSLPAATPLREISASADGAFRFRRLAAGGGDTLALFALAQQEVRPTLDPTRDRVAFGPDTLVLSAAAPRIAGISLSLVKPDAPGAWGGRAPEIAPGSTVLLRSVSDTAAVLDAEVDSTGSFLIDSVPPGTYRTRLRDPEGVGESPLPGFPETLRVRPGERIVPPPADSLAAADSVAAADTLDAAAPDTSSAGEPEGREP